MRAQPTSATQPLMRGASGLPPSIAERSLHCQYPAIIPGGR